MNSASRNRSGEEDSEVDFRNVELCNDDMNCVDPDYYDKCKGSCNNIPKSNYN